LMAVENDLETFVSKWHPFIYFAVIRDDLNTVSFEVCRSDRDIRRIAFGRDGMGRKETPKFQQLFAAAGSHIEKRFSIGYDRANVLLIGPWRRFFVIASAQIGKVPPLK